MKIVKLIKILIAKLLDQKRTVIVADTQNLQKKVVLISGASQGVGKTVARMLHERGARVCVVGRDKEKLQKAFRDQKDVLKIQCDVTNEKNIENAVRECKSHFGRIDVLINCAGLFLDTSITDITEKQLNEILDTNVKSMFLMSKYCVPLMKKQKNGLVINMGSKISHNTNVTKNKTAYAASKYAVEGFSQALRNELVKTGIRVTCLLPATIDTFPSVQSGDYLIPEEIGAVIATIIVQEHTVFEHVQLQSIDQQL